MTPKEARKAYFDKRNATIKQAYDAGTSIEALMICFNLSRQRIILITDHKEHEYKSQEVKPTRKLSLYDSKNADLIWERALGQGAFN